MKNMEEQLISEQRAKLKEIIKRELIESEIEAEVELEIARRNACLPVIRELGMSTDEFDVWYYFRGLLELNNQPMFRASVKYVFKEDIEFALRECDFTWEIFEEAYQYGERLFMDKEYAKHATKIWNEKFKPALRRAVN